MTTDVAVARPLTPAARAMAQPSQATQIEQARAVAEVQAMVLVAQQCPRNAPAAINAMKDACGRKELAERAFYRYKRGNGYITGETIVLAQTLALIWGNIQYGLHELRRDETGSELLAFAWDLQTNTRPQSTFIVPPRLYTGGSDLGDDLRALQENNASVGSRRVREAIFKVIPAWFLEEAKTLCRKTLADGGGRTIPQRVASAIELFGQLGITVAQLENKLGRRSGDWRDLDLAQLRIIHSSIINNETTRGEEFPDEAVTPADARPAARAAPVAPGQLASLETERTRLEFDDPAEWVATVARIALVPDLAEIGALTAGQAQLALKEIRGKSRPDVVALAAGDGQGTLGGDE